MTDRRLSVLTVEVDVVGAQRALANVVIEAEVLGARALSGLLVEADIVVSLVPTNAARWSGLAFEMGTASPLAYWSSSAFQTSGTTPVVWVTDHFEVSP